MKNLFKAIDKSLEHNDTEWYELYREMNLSYLDKCKVVMYIKYHFYIPLNEEYCELSNYDRSGRIDIKKVMDFLIKPDRDLIKNAVPIAIKKIQQPLNQWMSDSKSEFSIRNKRLNFKYVWEYL